MGPRTPRVVRQGHRTVKALISVRLNASKSGRRSHRPGWGSRRRVNRLPPTPNGNGACRNSSTAWGPAPGSHPTELAPPHKAHAVGGEISRGRPRPEEIAPPSIAGAGVDEPDVPAA